MLLAAAVPAGEGPVLEWIEDVVLGPEYGGSAEHLSTLDRQLDDFFHRHISPGARTAEVRIAYWRHWGYD